MSADTLALLLACGYYIVHVIHGQMLTEKAIKEESEWV